MLPGGDLRATGGRVQPASATLSVDGRAEVRQSRVIRVGLSQCGHLVRKTLWGRRRPLPWHPQDKESSGRMRGGVDVVRVLGPSSRKPAR